MVANNTPQSSIAWPVPQTATQLSAAASSVSIFIGSCMKKHMVFLFLFLFVNNVQAKIYKWVDADGTVHFSQHINDAPESQEVKEIEVGTTNTSQPENIKASPGKNNTKKKENNKINSKQLDEKCVQLSRVWAMEPDRFKSQHQDEYIRLGCREAAMKRLKNP